MTKEHVFNAIFQPEPEGGFTVIVPSLPGCVTYGETLKKAQEMAQEAIELYLECMDKQDEKIPENDTPALLTSIHIAVRTHDVHSSRPARKRTRVLA